jgi:hypothetical protein
VVVVLGANNLFEVMILALFSPKVWNIIVIYFSYDPSSFQIIIAADFFHPFVPLGQKLFFGRGKQRAYFNA